MSRQLPPVIARSKPASKARVKTSHFCDQITLQIHSRHSDFSTGPAIQFSGKSAMTGTVVLPFDDL